MGLFGSECVYSEVGGFIRRWVGVFGGGWVYSDVGGFIRK